jgi:dTMP kinase
MNALKGRFIVFDGPDGSGKSTQFHRFAHAAQSAGLEVCEVREPGGTPIGEAMRGLLLDPRFVDLDVRAEMLMYMASRAQLVIDRIRPALQKKQLVLADRFVSSTLAYQGTAGGLPMDDIRHVAQVACGNCMPDLVVIFDVDEKTAATRLNPLLDRMEAKGSAFHKRVRAGYLQQAADDPAGHLVIDASGDADSVSNLLFKAVESLFSASKQA